MSSADFDGIAARYERDSLVQRSAAEKLIGLLDIGRADDVLDLGCGSGGVTRRLRSLTSGRVTGLDPSGPMIEEAERDRSGLRIEFRSGSVESLDDEAAYTVIFCNSAFQWFPDPERALANCFKALRPGGRMAIQAPAKREYCPNFLTAMDAVARDPRTAVSFSGLRAPWTFFDSEAEYAGLFLQAGFTVPFAKIETITTRHSPDEVTAIFESGAAAGYLNREYYSMPIDGDYCEAFRSIVRRSFDVQAGPDGKVDLTFNRIYLVATKGGHAARS